MLHHDDMDFKHAAIWCFECNAAEQAAVYNEQLRRANDIKEEEVYLRKAGEWVEERPRYKPVFVAPKEQPKPTVRTKEYDNARELFGFNPIRSRERSSGDGKELPPRQEGVVDSQQH
jgi:hypothetical protein